MWKFECDCCGLSRVIADAADIDPTPEATCYRCSAPGCVNCIGSQDGLCGWCFNDDREYQDSLGGPDGWRGVDFEDDDDDEEDDTV